MNSVLSKPIKLSALLTILCTVSLVPLTLSIDNAVNEQLTANSRIHLSDLSRDKKLLISQHFNRLETQTKLLTDNPLLAQKLQAFKKSAHDLRQREREAVLNYVFSPDKRKPKLTLDEYYELQRSNYPNLYTEHASWFRQARDIMELDQLILLDADANLIFSSGKNILPLKSLKQPESLLAQAFERAKIHFKGFDGRTIIAQLNQQGKAIGYVLLVTKQNTLPTLLHLNENTAAISLATTDLSSKNQIPAQHIEFLGTIWTITFDAPAQEMGLLPPYFDSKISLLYGFIAAILLINIGLLARTRLKPTALYEEMSELATNSTPILAEISERYIADRTNLPAKDKIQSFLKICSQHLDSLYQSIHRSQQLAMQSLSFARQHISNAPQQTSNSAHTEQAIKPGNYNISQLTKESESLVGKALERTRNANQASVTLQNTTQHMENAVQVSEMVARELNELIKRIETESSLQTDQTLEQLLSTGNKTLHTVETLKTSLKQMQLHSGEITHAIHDTKRSINKAKLLLQSVNQALLNPKSANLPENNQPNATQNHMCLSQLGESSETLVHYSNNVMSTINTLADHIENLNKEISRAA